MMETNNKKDDSEVNIDKSNHENIDDDHQAILWDKVNDHNNDLSGTDSDDDDDDGSTDVNAHSIDDDPMFHLFCHCHR